MAPKNLLGGLALDRTIKEWFAKFGTQDQPTVVEGALGGLPVEVAGRVVVRQDVTTRVHPKQITAAIPLGLVAATPGYIACMANRKRQGLTVFNDNAGSVYVGAKQDGDPYQPIAYWCRLEAGDYWEMPQPVYIGDIYLYAVTLGTIRIMEMD